MTQNHGTEGTLCDAVQLHVDQGQGHQLEHATIDVPQHAEIFWLAGKEHAQQAQHRHSSAHHAGATGKGLTCERQLAGRQPGGHQQQAVVGQTKLVARLGLAHRI